MRFSRKKYVTITSMLIKNLILFINQNCYSWVGLIDVMTKQLCCSNFNGIFIGPLSVILLNVGKLVDIHEND